MDKILTDLARMRTNLRRRLTEDEKHAIDSYANLVAPAPGFVINRILRGVPLKSNSGIFRAATRCIPLLDSAMGKAYSFPNDSIDTLYRGVSRVEVMRWKIGSVRKFRGFMSTSFRPAHSFLYQKCCVIAIRGSRQTAKFLYSPAEEEVILNRGTKLFLKSIKTVKTEPGFWKHPDIPLSEHPPFGKEIQIFDAIIVE